MLARGGEDGAAAPQIMRMEVSSARGSLPLMQAEVAGAREPEATQQVGPGARSFVARAHWRRRFASCCQDLPERYDRFMLRGFEIQWPLPVEVMPRVRGMRLPFLVGCIAGFGGTVTQLCILIPAWLLVIDGLPALCGGLNFWLLFYCVVMMGIRWVRPYLPRVGVLGGPVSVIWSVVGMLLRNEDCLDAAPDVYGFPEEMLRLGLLASVFTGVSANLLGRATDLAIELETLTSPSGPAWGVTRERILQDAPVVAAPEGECSICLEGAGEADGEAATEEGRSLRWRQLMCGHTFHEACLLEWLERGRRCPLCRLDLQLAYHPMRREGGGGGEEGSELEASRSVVLEAV